MNPHDPSPPAYPLDAAGRQALSAFADGRADAAAAACKAWREDAGARRAWHTYHLIGDVLRSEELARPATADAAFLNRLRERLADEPVVLAPEPAAVAVPALPTRRMPRWVVPSAVAAGFVAVAGVLVVTRMNAPDATTGGSLLSRAPSIAVPAALSAPALTLAGEMIRDRELDAYLDAHQAARSGRAVAVPGGMLRSASVALPASASR